MLYSDNSVDKLQKMYLTVGLHRLNLVSDESALTTASFCRCCRADGVFVVFKQKHP
jgi:hypothetical protein